MILDTNALSALLDKDAALLEAIRESRELALPCASGNGRDLRLLRGN